MIVEVVAVGTELLLGQIANGNGATIGAALAENGLDAHYQQVVGDNHERLTSAIRLAIERSDAVIITGGIGPTQDDITREAVCAATGREMRFSDEYAEHLRAWWERRGRLMPESNLQQAEYPEGAELLMNPKGTAPGLALDHGGTLVFCVPGVPSEMEHLLHKEVIPRIVERSDGSAVVVSRVLKTWGQSESGMGEMLDDIYRRSTNPSLAFLASSGEIKLRITAKADNAEEAELLIAPVEAEVRDRVGPWLFAVDDETVHDVVFRQLREKGWTVGTAESMTGGMVAASLTSVAGSSEFVRGGLIAYDPELKERLLGVTDTTTVVDIDTAVQMAVGGRGLLGADVVVSVTGSAGPNLLEKPAGTVVVAVATPEGARGRELIMPGDRERVRTYGTTTALQMLRLAITGQWWKP